MSFSRAVFLLLTLCLSAAAGDAWAVRQNGVIEIPAHTGKDVGFALYPLDDDRLKLADGAIVLKAAGKIWTSLELPLDYKTIGKDDELTVDFVATPDQIGLTRADVDKAVSFAKANGVKSIIGYIYPEFRLDGAQPVTIKAVDGKPVAELGDVVVYVCETVARHPAFLARRVHRVVVPAP